jgi:hypothetical protein
MVKPASRKSSSYQRRLNYVVTLQASESQKQFVIAHAGGLQDLFTEKYVASPSLTTTTTTMHYATPLKGMIMNSATY